MLQYAICTSEKPPQSIFMRRRALRRVQEQKREFRSEEDV